MANIQKTKKEELEEKKQSLEKNLERVKVGQVFISGRDSLCIVREIKRYKKESDLTVYYSKSYDSGKTFSKSNYGSEELEKFIENYEDTFINDIEQWKKEVEAVIKGELSIDSFRDKQDISQETGLMQIKSKEYLESLKESFEVKKKRAEIVAKGVYMEMERKKEELDVIRRQLEMVVKEFRDKVEQIEKVIWTIELYLGIKEDIVQIQEGQSAGDNETINFWQNTLYMDEEVGDPMDGGLDFKNIQDFDNWVLKYSKFYKKPNYQLLIPQQKGLIVFRVRREDKQYSNNPWVNSMLNQDNKETYILIRNGTNVYRIWGDITIYPKLFPDRTELEELRQKWEFLTDQEESGGTRYIGDSKFGYISDTSDEKKKIDKQLFRYKQYMIMLQGLIDRTEIFYPIAGRITVLSPESHDKGQVKFVYEDDLRLTDGKLSFKEWQKELNKNVSEGSRILFIDNVSSGNGNKEFYERFDQRYHRGTYYSGKTHYNLPKGPNTSIYQVKKYVTKDTVHVKAVANSKAELPKYVIDQYSKGRFDKEDSFPHEYEVRVDGRYKYETITLNYLAIYYNPGDEVRNTWDYYDSGHERKNCISYKVYPEDRDILAYDFIDLKDVEYYLYERRHRKEYLAMMPILWKVKEMRENELLQETEFVKGLVEDMKRHKQKIENPKQAIWDAVEWYKTKNKWKRPLTGNDQLAWRMIKKKLGLKTE